MAQSFLQSDAAGNLRQVSAVAVAADGVNILPQQLMLKPGETARFTGFWVKRPQDTVTWSKNGTQIPGQTGDALSFPITSSADEGNYTITVTTPSGTFTSGAAKILYDGDGDGLQDSWEITNWGNLTKSGDGDEDFDGFTNAEEFEDGTNPRSLGLHHRRLRLNPSNGRIISDPPSATGRYATGTAVTLQAEAPAGWEFDSWSGSFSSVQPVITVGMASDLQLTANFRQVALVSAASAGTTPLAWTTGGHVPWRGLSQSGAPEGGALARSGIISHNQSSWIETTVTGPGTVSWWWKVSSEAGDALSCEIDGEAVIQIDGESGWRPVEKTLGPGPHVIRWTYAKNASDGSATGHDSAWLDKVAVSTEHPSAIATALDLSATADLLASGHGIWMRQTAVTNDGVDALKTPPIVDSEQAWIETTVVGPGVVSFWWKVSSQTSADKMDFLVNGVSAQTLSGEQNWVKVEKYVNGAEHKLRWQYSKDITEVTGEDAGWLDQVTFTPSPTLAQALDQPALSFATGGDQPWITDLFASGTHDGIDSAQSGPIGGSQKSWMETTVTGPGTVSFWWQVSSNPNGDNFYFMLDGVVNSTITGSTAWTRIVQNIPAGTHTLRWSYEKNDLNVSGADRGYLDEVVWTPGSNPLAEAVDAPGLSFQSTGAFHWSGQTATTHDGSDAAQAGPLSNSSETARFGTLVQGPGVVRFWWKGSMASSTSSGRFLGFHVNGSLVRNVIGVSDWIEVVEYVPPGLTWLDWMFIRPASSGGVNSAWVDEISYTPGTPVSLATALDGAGLEWATGGTANWIATSASIATDGVDMATSPRLGSNGHAWLETTVTGPGVLDFKWADSTDSDHTFYYEVNGETASPRVAAGAWSSVISNLPAGTHRLKWHYVKSGGTITGSDTVFLDAVRFQQITPPLAEAVDAPGLAFHTGARPWGAQVEMNHDTIDAVKSGPTADDSSSWLRTRISGPGTLSFWWRVSSASGDSLQFLQDGTSAVSSISGTAGTWAQVTHAVPAGNHLYTWQYAKNASGAAGSDAGWVDEIVFTPTTNDTFFTAVELPAGSLFRTGGTAGVGEWEVQSTVTHDGVDALKSPPLGHSQQKWFESTVTGPGVLGFWYKVSSQASGDFLEFWIDDETQLLRTSGELDWRKYEVMVPEGRHQVLWKYTKNSSTVAGQDAVWIDEITMSPQIPLAAALDTTLMITTGGSDDWEGQPGTTRAADGIDSAASGLIASGQQSWMETSVNGPGTLAFDWRNSGADNDASSLRLIVDGVEERRLTGITTWEKVVRSLGPGAHTVRWSFHRTTTSVAGDNRGYVDGLSFTPATVPPLEEAIERAGVPVLSYGAATWTRDTAVHHDGVDALRSGTIGASLGSHVTQTVTGPAMLGFWWKVSSAATGGYLRCYVDGVEATTAISGNVDWERRSLMIGSGTHEVTWSYLKNAVAPAGSDAGWIDEVTLTPTIGLPVALDTTGMTWTTGGDAAWLGFADGGTDWAASGTISHSQESWLETMITGPGTLGFNWNVGSAASDFLVFTHLGKNVAWRSGTPATWQGYQQSLPPGLHTLRWRYVKDASGTTLPDRAQVDAVTFAPQAAPPLADAVDAPALAFGTYGPDYWVRDSVVSRDGVDSLRSTATAHSTSSSASARVTGPGTLSFWWKVSSHTTDYLRLYINDVERGTGISGERDWALATVYLAEGEHLLRWSYILSTTLTGGQNAAWLDQVSFTPDTITPSLGEALEQPGLEWTSGPAGVPWKGIATGAAWDGTDVAAVLAPDPVEPSWIETNVNGPATLSFRWRTDSGRRAYFYVDQVETIYNLNQSSAWTTVQYALPTGRHTLRWEAYSQGLLSSGSAGAWLDAVSLVSPQYTTWANSFTLTGGNADPFLDFEGDGLENLVEYAFNLDPKSGRMSNGNGPTAGRLPVCRIEGSGANARLVVEYLRRQGGGVTYTPRFGDDLEHWSTTAGAPVVTDLGGGWDLVKVPDVVTVGSGQGRKRFASVAVSMP